MNFLFPPTCFETACPHHSSLPPLCNPCIRFVNNQLRYRIQFLALTFFFLYSCERTYRSGITKGLFTLIHCFFVDHGYENDVMHPILLLQIFQSTFFYLQDLDLNLLCCGLRDCSRVRRLAKRLFGISQTAQTKNFLCACVKLQRRQVRTVRDLPQD